MGRRRKQKKPANSGHRQGPADPSVELVRQGKNARDAYDYAEAERLFREALDLSGGALPAAAALLELLVGTLAMDETALDVARDLPHETQGHPSVRRWMALAAARLGRIAQAVELVEGLEGPGVQDIHLALAEGAIRDGRFPDARHHLDAARTQGPVTSRVLKLEDRFAEACAAGLEPAERRARVALDHGELDQAEKEALAILEIWPRSEAAHEVLRAISRARVQARIDHLVAKAQDAETRGDLEQALAALREAQALDPSSESMARRVERLELEVARKRVERDVEDLVAAFEARLSDTDLARYLRLPDEARREVRTRVTLPALEWAETVLRKDRNQERRRIVEGILTLAEVSNLSPDEDPETILERLRPHAALLGDLDPFQRLRTAAQQGLERFRARRARTMLDEVASLLDRQEVPRAETIWNRIDESFLAPEDLGRYRDLAGRLARERKILDLETALEASQDDPVGARTIALNLVSLTTGSRQAQYRDRLHALDAALREQWQVTRVAVDLHAVGTHDVDPRPRGRHHALTLLEDASRVVSVTTFGHHLFLRVIDPAGGQVEDAVSMTIPWPLSRPRASVDANTLWITGGDGFVLGVTLDDWRVVTARRLEARRSSGEHVTAAATIPGTPFVWYRVTDSRGGHALAIARHDARLQRVKTLEGARGFLLAAGTGSERPILVDIGGQYAWYYPDGTPFPDGSDIAWQQDVSIGGPGCQPGAVAVIRRIGRPRTASERRNKDMSPLAPDMGDLRRQSQSLSREDARDTWTLESSGPDGTAVATSDPELLERVQPLAMAASVEDRLTFVLCRTWRGQYRLRAYQPAGGRFDTVWEVAVPSSLGFVHAPLARAVWTAVATGEKIRFSRAGNEPPLFGVGPRWLETTLPDLEDVGACMLRQDPPDVEIEQWVRKQAGTDAARNDWLPELRKALPGKTKRLLEAARALWWLDRPLACLDLLAWIREFHPEATDFALERATEYAVAGAWGEVRRIMAKFDPNDVHFYAAAHASHVASISALLKNQLKIATALWEDGLNRAASLCDLEGLLSLVRDEDSSANSPLWVRDTHAAAALRRAVKVASDALERRDWAEVVSILDHPVLWREMELYSLARLAEAWLRQHAEEPGALFRKRLALAAFVAVQAESEHDPDSVVTLMSPGDRWRRRRLADIARRATAWLTRRGSGR